MKRIKSKEFCQAVKTLSFLEYYWLIYDGGDAGFTKRDTKRVRYFLKKGLYEEYRAMVPTSKSRVVKLSSRRHQMLHKLVLTTKHLEKYTTKQLVEVESEMQE